MSADPLVVLTKAMRSPPGDQVAFVSDRDGDTELYLVAVPSGQVRRLTSPPGNNAQPAWLPDGKLMFTAWVNGTPRLRWLDPVAPDQATDVPVGSLTLLAPPAPEASGVAADVPE